MMTYIIQGEFRGKDASISLADRKNAFEVGKSWSKEGYTNVKIMGEGRVFLADDILTMDANLPSTADV